MMRGGNPDHRCYELPKGEMSFPCLHDMVGDYEWVELERRPEGAVGRCICGKTFWWKEGQDDERLNQVREGVHCNAIRIVWEIIGIGLLIGTLVLLGRLFLDLQTFVNMW